MTATVAEDGNRQLITMIETTCRNGTVLLPLIIYKGAKRHIGWYQYWDENTEGAEYLFASRKLGMEWLKNFDEITKPHIMAICPYRLLIIDEHGPHITLEFV